LQDLLDVLRHAAKEALKKLSMNPTEKRN